MTQALQTWSLAPACAWGNPTLAGSVKAVGWFGPHHCWACWVSLERACAEFDAAVARGAFDANGYTPSEQAQRQMELFA